jgi:hypothetical protein
MFRRPDPASALILLILLPEAVMVLSRQADAALTAAERVRLMLNP